MILCRFSDLNGVCVVVVREFLMRELGESLKGEWPWAFL